MCAEPFLSLVIFVVHTEGCGVRIRGSTFPLVQGFTPQALLAWMMGDSQNEEKKRGHRFREKGTSDMSCPHLHGEKIRDE